MYLRLLALLLLSSCAPAPAPLAFREPDTQHFGDDWFAYRAKGLGISIEDARARDAALAEDAPPEGIWDEQTLEEARALWANNCAKCHGLDGDPSTAPTSDPPFDPPPKRWKGVGPDMGFFFGGDKMRVGVYARIKDGGLGKEGAPSRMPAWRDSLAREQMWALVFFIQTL
jgi:mono/diheme cytochrome c family protein